MLDTINIVGIFALLTLFLGIRINYYNLKRDRLGRLIHYRNQLRDEARRIPKSEYHQFLNDFRYKDSEGKKCTTEKFDCTKEFSSLLFANLLQHNKTYWKVVGYKAKESTPSTNNKPKTNHRSNIVRSSKTKVTTTASTDLKTKDIQSVVRDTIQSTNNEGSGLVEQNPMKTTNTLPLSKELPESDLLDAYLLQESEEEELCI